MTDTKISLGADGMFLHRNSDVPFAQYQILGERGSGTNVVRKTMQKNIPLMRVETLGWKHGFPHMTAIPNNLLVVCVVRNAWDWAQSMHKRPWHAEPDMQALDFSDFIRAEWRSIVDRPKDFEMLADELDAQGAPLQYDRHPITGKRFENLFALRHAKLEGLMGISNRDCSFVFVTLESFNADPKAFVTALGTQFDIPRRPRPFRTVTRRMGNLHNRSVEAISSTTETDFSSDFSFMCQTLDLDVERRLGYEYTTQ